MTLHAARSSVDLGQSTHAIRAALDDAAAARQRQLDDTPHVPDDPVTGARRDRLEQTLAEIRAAQARLETGSFGSCQRCLAPIPVERLELRPWAPHCVPCGDVSM
jgi:RNA polymerase-binding transcription factor DksA